MTSTLGGDTISPKLARIAELARHRPAMVFTTLFHNIDLDWMREAYRRTRKSGAVGVDGQDAAAFAEDLEGNLRRLLDAAKSGTYRAPPVKRVHIPKGDGSTSRTSWTARTASDRVARRTGPWTRCAPVWVRWVDAGFWRSIYESSSTRWNTTMSGRC